MATSVIGRSLRVVVVLGGVALAGWLWHAGRGRQPQAPTESDAMTSAQRLAAWLREKSAALQARAATLSDLPRLAAAVATDAETVRDLTRDELGFATAANETVELAQLSTASGAPAVTTLLRLPESSAWRADFTPLARRNGATGGRVTEAAKAGGNTDGVTGAEKTSATRAEGATVAAKVGAADEPDVTLAVDGAWLVMTRTRAIVPRDRADVTGAIAVAWRFPVEDMSAALDGGTLVIGGKAMSIGGGVPAGARTASVMLPGIPSAATLETALGPEAVPPDWGVRALGVGAGTALALLALVWPRRRREAAPSPSRAMSIPVQQAPVVDSTPARVGRYEPVALMRADDAAKVYVARTTGEAGFERRVTVTVFGPRDEKLVQAFVGDARRAARVQHPNLVEVLDIGGSADACYVATEYVEGGDLALLLSHLRSIDRRVPVGIAIAIARRMCDGLAAAHAATDETGAPLGLLHGGLAPSHVTISRTGSVKVGDFGLARAAGSSPSLPGIAPELRERGEPADVRADVFGVGAVLYELLAGEAPRVSPRCLEDESPERDAAGSLYGGRRFAAPGVSPIELSQLRGDVPPELASTVNRALARDRRARPRDCVALEAELAAIAHGHGLDTGDKQIAHWLATDLQSWSPTLRGWQAAADPRLAQLLTPRPTPKLERPSARALAMASTSSDALRVSGLRAAKKDNEQRTVNVRPTARASTPPAVRASTPPPSYKAPESGEYTAVAEWNEPAGERRPRASSPRFYEVAGPMSGPHARATAESTSMPVASRGSSPGTSPETMLPATAAVWLPVPETQTNIVVDPDERRTQSVDANWTDDEKTPD